MLDFATETQTASNDLKPELINFASHRKGVDTKIRLSITELDGVHLTNTKASRLFLIWCQVKFIKVKNHQESER